MLFFQTNYHTMPIAQLKEASLKKLYLNTYFPLENEAALNIYFVLL